MKQGWEIKRLGDICEISTGKSNTVDAFENGEYAFFDRSKKAKRSSKYLFDCDAIIIAGEGQTFLPKFYSGKFDLHQRAYAIYSFITDVNIQYAFKYLIHFHKYFENVAVGATAKSLRLRHFQELPIPIPPLDEQEHIVAKLDKCFEAIDNARANIEKNLQNAEELFRSKLNQILIQKDDGWTKNPLTKLCQPNRIITYGVIKLGEEVTNGVPCLRTSNVRWLEIDTTTVKRILPSLSNEFSRTVLKGGEVLVNVRGSLGGVAVVTEEMNGWNVSREIAVVPIDPSKIDPNYLTFWIGTDFSQKWLESVKKGAAYVGINIEDLRKLSVKAPNLIEQRNIVKEINSLRKNTKSLESHYQQELDALDELKKSILQKAFNGKL